MYLFACDWGTTNAWSLAKKLIAPGGEEFDRFGHWVTLDGPAPHDDQLSGMLTASSGTANDHYGVAVAVDDALLAIGADSADADHPYTGAGYVCR